MWGGMFPQETENALLTRARHPEPLPPPKPSFWAQAGELVASPFTGAAQGVNETLRVAANVIGSLPSAPSVKAKNEQITAAFDEQLRSGAEHWRPDPQTAGWATQFLHEGGRIIAKAAGYSLAGGVPGAVIGTGIDEGATGYLEMRDKKVDPGTAAKVGLVRGGATALTMAAPVAGRTALQTAGLVLATGPGTYVAQETLTRNILENARYHDLAAQHDPFAIEGLLASLVPGAVIGGAVHAVRARRGKASAGTPEPVNVEAALADTPEVRDAAHVAFQRDTLDAGMLAERSNVEARVTHEQALQETHAAIEEGRPPELGTLRVDEATAAQAMADMKRRLEAVPRETAEPVPAGRTALDETRIAHDGLGVGQEVARALQALAEIKEGRPADAALRDVSPQVQNLVMGLRQLGDDPAQAQRFLNEYRNRVASVAGHRMDIAADLVDEGPARLDAPSERRAPQVEQRLAAEYQPARGERAAGSHPDLPVRLTEDRPPTRAADLYETERAAAKQDAELSQTAYRTAIECALRLGD